MGKPKEKKVSKTENYKRVSEYIPPALEVDEFVKIESVIGEELVITGFQERSGEWGVYFTVSAHYPNDKATIGFNTGSAVIIKRLRAVAGAKGLPCLAKVVEIKGKKQTYHDIQ